jgi:hypothetical protein
MTSTREPRTTVIRPMSHGCGVTDWSESAARYQRPARRPVERPDLVVGDHARDPGAGAELAAARCRQGGRDAAVGVAEGAEADVAEVVEERRLGRPKGSLGGVDRAEPARLVAGQHCLGARAEQHLQGGDPLLLGGGRAS